MALPIKRQRHIRRMIIAAIGPRLGGELYSKLTIWEKSCGSEWTVTRLKALRSVALQIRAGNIDIATQIMKDEGIAFSPSNPFPMVKGIWGVVITRFIKAKKPSVLRRLSSLFRVYTAIFLDSVSKSQLDKTRKAIKDAPVRKSTFGESHKSVIQMRRNLKLYKNSISLPQPDLGRLKANSSYFRNIRTGREPWSKAIGSLLSAVYIPESLKDVNPCEDLREALEKAGAENETPGRIHFIQEGGAKARVVAIPNVWCQWLFEPLHKGLDKFIKNLPQSAVHDHAKGGFFLSNHIGKPIWCYDLSSATDRFPRTLQLQVLEWLGLPHFAKALEEISSANWKMLDETISYGAGQPMGLYGSFPLFHLTHYALLELASIESGYHDSDRPKPFMVLGDDVIIIDPEVAKLYRYWMDMMGVPVSPTKSIASSEVGEFAGFLTLRTNKGNCTFRPYKFKPNGFSNPLSILHSFGKEVRHLGPYWSKMFNIFSQTLSMRDLDLSPLLREDEQEGVIPPTIDSQLLGSHVMRASYEVDYEFPELKEIWWDARQVLLGRKERLNSSGFSDKNSNPIGIGVPTIKDELSSFSLDLRISADPLIRALRYAKKV